MSTGDTEFIQLMFAAFLGFFAPDFTLRPALPRRVENANTKEFLQLIKTEILDNLKQVRHAPSVQMQPVPRDLYDFKDLENVRAEQCDPDGPVKDET